MSPDHEYDAAAADAAIDAGHVGGCLCGTIRYRLMSEPVDPGYCHCRMCQRFSGAPVMA